MALTLIGVIYNTATLQVTKIVQPDDDSELPLHVDQGESLVTYPIGEAQNLTDPSVVANLIATAQASLI